MAKILLLTLVFAPDAVSTATLMTHLAQGLKACGHEVTVLTTTPHYNDDPIARAQQPLARRWNGLLYKSQNQGMTVWHASIPVKGDRVGARILDYLRFHAISTLAGLTVARDYDIILTPSPPLTIGISAWILSLLKRVPFIYNVQEIYPDVAVKLGVLQNKRAIRFFEALERFIYQRSNKITVISEWFRRTLRDEKSVPDRKLVVIPNFTDADFIQPHPRHNSFSAEHGLDDKFVVLYLGNIGLTQGMETIMEAATKVRHQSDILFLIVGDGTRRAWLEAELQRADRPNVKLLPYQPYSLVPLISASSDVCLVPLKRGTAQDTFPSKIYSIMAAAKPAIASADPDSELAWVVEQSGGGWAIPPDDADAMAQAVLNAYNDQASAQHKGEAGRAYVLANHTRQAIAAKYDTLIRSMLGQP